MLGLFEWPLDFSCSGFFFIMAVCAAIMGIGMAQAAEKAANLAKKIAENETAKEIGKEAAASWLESLFKK